VCAGAGEEGAWDPERLPHLQDSAFHRNRYCSLALATIQKSNVSRLGTGMGLDLKIVWFIIVNLIRNRYTMASIEVHFEELLVNFLDD
jgi:hypothetical protein